MAMNATTLKATIKTKIKAKPGYSKLDDGAMSTIIDVMIEEIIAHIQNNAVVSTTVAVTSVGGVTTGAGVSGPGTGTGAGGVQ